MNAAAIEARYHAEHPASAAAFREAERVMPGGNSRQAGYWRPFPLTLARGAGTSVWDVDGLHYFDLINNYSALVHGHAYAPIVAAVQRQVADGSAWTAANTVATELARALVGSSAPGGMRRTPATAHALASSQLVRAAMLASLAPLAPRALP